MALLLSGAVGALGMTDASMNQTGIEIKCLPGKKKEKKNHQRPEAGARNPVSLTISSNKSY